ncbi:hypothetical protein [Methylocapsa acidiphila]|uniref:hypothetical protein n=1 Tax=Methylocapsa acidiphila TaxID=133552 RepID=UPI00040C4FB3|nr:hypothetical protein [Methylocapsa acidiphila]
MRNLLLLAIAILCLAIALVLAWVLGVTLFFPNGKLAGLIVERKDLIRAHIDYLMMAQFLFIFFGLFKLFSIDPPYWVVGAASYGAIMNPLGFLKRALTPKIVAAAPVEPYFPVQAGVSFTLATVGLLAAAALIFRAAWAARDASASKKSKSDFQAG